MQTDGGESGSKELVDCGRPFPGHELAIIDEAGHRLGERHVGQVVVRGPSVTPGYFQEPELTAQTYRVLPDDPDGEPWLFTGDLGYRVGDRLFVCGRLKDIIIVRGRNYYPSDIEWVVSELPGVRRGNVVAFGVDVAGEEQLVVCCEGASADAMRVAQEATSAVRIGRTVRPRGARGRGGAAGDSAADLERQAAAPEDETDVRRRKLAPRTGRASLRERPRWSRVRGASRSHPRGKRAMGATPANPPTRLFTGHGPTRKRLNAASHDEDGG